MVGKTTVSSSGTRISEVIEASPYVGTYSTYAQCSVPRQADLSALD
jgi:hypothetical protein